MEEEIVQINKKLDRILEILENQNQTCKKLDKHIDFVEDTYSIVREPLNFVYDKVNRLMGNNKESSLLMIKDEK